MLLFLDCEWADINDAELVSLALVGEDPSRVFYAERGSLPVGAPPFVQEVVYPLLERGAAALTDLQFAQALRDFLSSIGNPTVVADYRVDFELLRFALNGLDLPSSALSDLRPLPEVEELLVSSVAMQSAIESCFSTQPSLSARRHNALVDAQVLRQAWFAVDPASRA